MAAESEFQDYFEKAESIIAKVAGAVLEGGQVQAAFYQGAHEMGAALKAFPDAIQIDEPGAAFNPLYRDRDGATPSHPYGAGQDDGALPLPSEIAGVGQAQGSVHGDAPPSAAQGLPSPSEIASDPTPYMPPPDQGNVQGPDHGQEMGRGV